MKELKERDSEGKLHLQKNHCNKYLSTKAKFIKRGTEIMPTVALKNLGDALYPTTFSVGDILPVSHNLNHSNICCMASITTM